MSNSTYEIMWRDAMGDLNEQLNVEGVEEEVYGVHLSRDTTRYTGLISPLMNLVIS